MNDNKKIEERKATLLHFRNEEIRLLDEFRTARKKLESLVSEVSKHNRLFNEFWNTNYDYADELLVRDPVNTFEYYVIQRPKREDANIESYLPFTVVSKTFNPI